MGMKMVTWVVETGIFVDEDDNESNLIHDIESTGARVIVTSWKDVIQESSDFTLPEYDGVGVF